MKAGIVFNNPINFYVGLQSIFLVIGEWLLVQSFGNHSPLTTHHSWYTIAAKKCKFIPPKCLMLAEKFHYFNLLLNRSKTRSCREAFDRYLLFQLEGSLPPRIPLEIHHLSSQEGKGIQAVDLFCWGIFKKYENNDTKWYQLFKDKIVFEAMYSEIKKEPANPTRHNPKD